LKSTGKFILLTYRSTNSNGFSTRNQTFPLSMLKGEAIFLIIKSVSSFHTKKKEIGTSIYTGIP